MTRRGQLLFFVPAFTLFLVFVLLPSTLTLLESVYPRTEDGREWVGGLFYSYALTDPQFRQSLGNNLVYLFLTLIFEVVVGLALAVGLQREGRLNNFLRIAFFSPNVLSLVIVGLVFGFLFKAARC
jgi:ABC-type sugar transport system permease subunit